MIDDLNHVCGPRLHLPKVLHVKWFNLRTMKDQSSSKAVANIERQLRLGKRVILSVKSSFSSHVMTVQGISEDCRFIIQNSNSLGEQPAEIYPKYNSTHIQLWSKEQIEEVIYGYGYLQEKSGFNWISGN